VEVRAAYFLNCYNQPMKIIPYQELAFNEGVQVQKGMNFNVKKSYSIILMSTVKKAPDDAPQLCFCTRLNTTESREYKS